MKRLVSSVSVLAVIGIMTLGLVSDAWGQEVTYERLVHAAKDPSNWLTYYGTYTGWRYSSLQQINTKNVQKLVVKWAFQTGPDEHLVVTPLVVDGIMYITSSKNHVFALDATTGKVLWRFNYTDWPDPDKMPARKWEVRAGTVRGVSIAKGKVFLGTGDAHLIALDARTGTQLWKTPVGDYTEGHAVTSPPLIVKDKAILGFGTLEFPTRGYIVALDIETGQEVWRFYTVPGLGEPGNETWGGDSWKYGCGPAWLPGTYDPELNLVYIGTGNPCPMWNGDDRPGDNLYTNSILALDPETGTLQWYFQTIPHDVWDLDAVAESVLVDIELQGKPVKALFQANKNGYLYALDRTTGRFLYARPFVSRLNWTKGLDEKGRPIPGVVPTGEEAVICPSGHGARSWNHAAYSPQTAYLYTPALDLCANLKRVEQKPEKGALYLGGGGSEVREGAYGGLTALDVRTGEIKWQYRSPYPMLASILTTGGGLVFTGDLEGHALAFDATNGALLWKFHTSSGHRGSPMSYAVGGRQYIAIPSGWGGITQKFFAQAFPELAQTPTGSTLFVFGLFEE